MYIPASDVTPQILMKAKIHTMIFIYFRIHGILNIIRILGLVRWIWCEQVDCCMFFVACLLFFGSKWNKS